jgi:glutathione S-transferase
MVDFSSDTLLNGYVEFVGWNNTTDSPQNTVDYGDTILQHTKEWQDTVTSMVDSAFAEYKLLEQQCLHYKTKTGRLRRYSRRVKSLRFSFAADKLEKKFERNYDKMQDTTDRCKQKADELCFLLDQVSKYGWNDVYSLVKSTMEWEADRLEQEKQEFGAELPHAVERLTTLFPMAENEVATKPESIYGFSDTIHGELPNIDPSKPTLFLDDACPFTARVWITLLEKELDPSNPIGFHAIPVCSIDPQDTGYQMLQKLEIESSPFLMHMGNVFSESIRVAEYIDLLSNSHFVPSLQPSDQIGAFNMRTFIDRHAQIAEVFFSLMDTEDEDAKPDLAKEMFDLLRLIDKDLRKFNGPYLCGNCFSLADVNVYPFVEHIKAILSTFGSFSIPASLTALLEWYDTISKRPSIQIVTADRSIDGGKRNSSFKELKRNDYLVEYHQYRIDLGREYASEVTGSGDTADDEDSYYVNIPSLMPSLVELDTKPLEA